MVYGNALKSYQKTNIETADPIKLVIMCYDAILRDLEAARGFQQGHNMDRAHDKIRHAQDIITELLLSLDYERGGEISTNLSQLYNFMLRQLMGINILQDTNVFDHVDHMLRELREGWEHVRKTECQSACVASGQETKNWEVRA